ncbi:LptA/OstA family protein [Luteolibacter algae]|uniref:LptA/OstA family protein n=1 Tax=Luteolibacter algae TaxID=454151 RepID=A0ABW5D6F7_9BACT
MIPRLSIFLLTVSLLHAQEASEADVTSKSPIALLPSGSVLKGVLLPRYDAERKLVGDLKAEVMTLIDADRIQGENVLIKFYNPDHSIKGKVAMKNALFDQAKSLIYANEPVEIINDRLVARGSGLVYAFQTGKGFLRGPATTWISTPPKTTSMHIHPLPKAALIAACLLPQTLSAAPPAYVSQDELAALKAEAASAKPEIDKVNDSAEASLAADVAAGGKASADAMAFIKESQIKNTASESGNDQPATEPLKIEPKPEDTLIKCDDGMYFDADNGVLVYLGNVRVTDPRFTLSGANELKIFFDKKAPGNEKKNDTTPTANFGDVKKLIATGAVRILQKSVNGKEPVEASGAVLTYNIDDEEIIIHGGYPWVKQGTYFARAKEANLSLRLLNNGSFSTRGNWEMGGQLKLDGQ